MAGSMHTLRLACWAAVCSVMTDAGWLGGEFDCASRRLAARYADAALPGSWHRATLAEALQLQSANCSGAPARLPARSAPAPPASSMHRYVSPGGDDSRSGESAAAAWRTLERVLAFLGSAERPKGAGVLVTLGPGIYRPNGTLRMNASHSGAPGAEVRFEASEPAPGATVVSGGVALDSGNGVRWTRGRNSNVWTARISPDLGFGTDGMDSVREYESDETATSKHLARWPNGDPSAYCARDLHGGSCPGYAQVSDTVTKGTTKGMAAVGPTNAVVRSSQSGQLIFTGSMRPFDMHHEFNVSSPSAAWQRKKPTRSNFQAWAGGSLSRYQNTTFAYYQATLPSSAVMNADFVERARRWTQPQEAVVHMYQSSYWGNWGLRVASIDLDTREVKWSAGGFQEARGGTMGGRGGRGIRQDYFVENLLEELDGPDEFYFDKPSSTLHLMRQGSAPPKPGAVVAARLSRLLVIGGESKEAPVHDIQWLGVTFRDARSTFMAPHEATSGGDWSIHRGAAVVLENALRVTMRSCTWDGVNGNGVILSKYARGNVISESWFKGVGETPVVLLGVADLMDGRAGTHPIDNEISHNHLHHFGRINRQASGVFEGLACTSNISYNVIHDGPRAAVNMNDGFCGGTQVVGNLMFNAVLDTGEHGVTNSWDRQPMIWVDDTTGRLEAIPATRHIRGNLVFRTSFRGQTSNLWALDKDDGSSNYNESGNVLLYGAIKDRDGLDRAAVGNLLLFPEVGLFAGTTNEKALALQVSGFGTDSFVGNTVA